MQQVRNELSSAMEGESVKAFGKRIEAIEAQSRDGKINEAKQEIADIIFEWKEDYRRSCKV